MICGLEAPTSGKIYFGDDDVTELSPEIRGVGMVFQNYALYPHLTVMQNICFPLENLKGKDKLTKQQMKDKALEAAKLVQIEDFTDRLPVSFRAVSSRELPLRERLLKCRRCFCLMSRFQTLMRDSDCRREKKSAEFSVKPR